MTTQPDPVREYIRANLRINTREAIRDQLIAVGHDPTHVDKVWAEEWRTVSVARARGSIGTFALSVWVVLGLLGALGALATGGFGSSTTTFVLFVVLYAIVYIGLGYGILRLARWTVTRFGISGWPVALIGLVLVPVYVVLMFGGCLATLAAAQKVIQ